MRITQRLRRPLRRLFGFSLIEVMVAILLLAFILIGVAPLFTWSVRQNASADALTRCSALANEHLEFFNSDPLANCQAAVTAGGFAEDTIEVWNGFSEKNNLTHMFRRRTWVTQVGTSQLYKVRIEVAAVYRGADDTFTVRTDETGQRIGRRVVVEAML